MYPADFFNLFPAFPRKDRIFVAMDFGREFDHRWQRVLQPAIRRIGIDGVRQEPRRVDARVVSDNILTEILREISESRFILADVTMVGSVERSTAAGGRELIPVRNANVLYEVGLAHAVRLSEEVLLFRSDDRPLMFDVAPIRVNRYDPDGNPATAIEQVQAVILGAYKEVHLRRHFAVQRVASLLDMPSWGLLLEMATSESDAVTAGERHAGLRHPPHTTNADALANVQTGRAIVRLLELGVIETRPAIENDDTTYEEAFRYHVTPLGFAAYQHVLSSAPRTNPRSDRGPRTEPEGEP